MAFKDRRALKEIKEHQAFKEILETLEVQDH